MKFVDEGDTAASPLAEWMARVSPFMLASDPHQRCLKRAQDAGALHVNGFCDCPTGAPCQDECCNPTEEW